MSNFQEKRSQMNNTLRIYDYEPQEGHYNVANERSIMTIDDCYGTGSSFAGKNIIGDEQKKQLETEIHNMFCRVKSKFSGR